MIEVAQNMANEHARTCEWYVSDVCDMPFADSEFSVIFCQQGLQFFPDERTALTEMNRVLRPQGRIVLTVWSGPSALFEALAVSIGKYVGETIAERSLALFTYAGSDTLESQLSDLGFVDFSKRELSIDRIVVDPNRSVPREIVGNPVGPCVEEKGDVVMRNITEEIVEALSKYRQGANLVIPQRTYLFQASVP